MEPRPSPANPSPSTAPLPPARSDWLWCLACERAYARTGTAALEPCPHPACKGSVSRLFAWDWLQLRRAHPGYPETPRVGVVYSWLDD